MINPYRELSKINPQRENGHRQINSENFHALMVAGLSGAEYQVVLTVIDQTWGYNKSEAHISLTEFQRVTKLAHQTVIDAIHRLEDKRILLVERRGPGRKSWYAFNKYSDVWQTSTENRTSELVRQTVLGSKADRTTTSKADRTKTGLVAVRGTEPTIEKRKHIYKAAKESTVAIIIKTFSKHYPTTPEIESRLAEMAQEFPAGWVHDTIKQAADNGVSKPLPYITKVLKAWVVEGHPATREYVSAAPTPGKRASQPVDPEDLLDLSGYRERVKAAQQTV